MPRNMSFALTTDQFKDQSKTVTRRFGWYFLKPGDVVCGVEKAMGLKKGEKIKRLGLIEITAINTEPLSAITQDDCIREGFPNKTPDQFVDFIQRHYNIIDKDKPINRIEFKYI